LVLRARGDSAEAQQALGDLCAAYWQPVFRFIRSEGRDEESARDLTQEFFARLLARSGLAKAEPGRGRFRSYLLGAVKHFLSDRREHERRLKRGGGVPPESLNAATTSEQDTALELQTADPSALPPDSYFDREWALAVMDRAMTAAQQEYTAEGKPEHFETLKPWLAGEVPTLSQAQAATRLGISESAVKVVVHRLRKRFRELVKAELAQTVATPGEAAEELHYLVEVLSARRSG
jgi:RNA polymerase sigma factor (sigma-70 family)